MKAVLGVVAGLIMVLGAAVIQPASAAIWATNAPMLAGRYGHTATMLTNGCVLVVGGWDASYTETACIELFDPVTGWTNANPSYEARAVHTATLLNDGRVLVAGGSGVTGPLNSTELYDAGNDVWETNNALSVSRQGHTATILLDGTVLVAGGFAGLSASENELASAEIYDPVKGTWEMTGSLTNVRWGHTAILLPAGKVLVAGGVGNNSVLSTAELYDPNLGTWSPTGPMATARRLHTATLLPGGKVLVVGGAADTNDAPTAEVYDPASGTWTAAGVLNFPRHAHTATLLSDGRVLLAGGWTIMGDQIAPAETYDAATRLWTLSAPLKATCAFHSATLLPDGRVLVAGGFGDRFVLSDTEFYLEALPFNLVNPISMPDGVFRFGFSNTPGVSFSVLGTTDVTLSSGNWTTVGAVTEMSPGQFQFTDPQATNNPQRFYRVRAN